MTQIRCDEDVIDYVSRYGGRCRGCADEDGVCPTSHLPCDHASQLGAIRHVIDALNYGAKHGFIEPFIEPKP